MQSKYKFKYQQGGSPRVFNTPLPHLDTQGFAPLINMASQPKETGFSAQQFIAQLQQQKIQEQRMKEQMEMEKLKMQADLDHQKLVSESVLDNKIDKIKDATSGIDFLPTDMPYTEKAKEDIGLNDLYLKFKKDSSTANANEYIAATSKYMNHPDVRLAIQRSKIDEMYQKSKKDPTYSAAEKAGQLNDDEYRAFLDDRTSTKMPKLTINPEFGVMQSQQKEADAIKLEQGRQKLQDDKNNSKLLQPLLDDKQKTIDLYLKETDPAKKEILNKQLQDLDEKIYHRDIYRDKTGTTKDATYDNTLDSLKLSELYAYKAAHPRATSAEIDNFIKGKTAGNVDLTDPKEWETFFRGSKIGVLHRTASVLNNPSSDGTPNSIHVNGESIQTDPNTVFEPGYGSKIGSDGFMHIEGRAYKSVPKKDVDDYTKKGWVESGTDPEYATKLHRDADHVIVSATASMPLSRSKANEINGLSATDIPDTPNTPSGNLPKPIDITPPSTDHDKKLYTFLDTTKTIEWGDDKGVNTKDSFLKSSSDNAKKMVSSIAISTTIPIAVTGHSHHDDPDNFDLRSKDGNLAKQIHTPVFKQHLADMGYAVVFEHPDYKNTVNYKALKPGEVVTGKLTDPTSAQHYHFQRVGATTSSVNSDRFGKYMPK